MVTPPRLSNLRLVTFASYAKPPERALILASALIRKIKFIKKALQSIASSFIHPTSVWCITEASDCIYEKEVLHTTRAKIEIIQP